ncbi:uracil-DNA glycosylase [Mycoplasma procyoni]|uniref:uracil-DNA glycosylase n=1 Tax=Mycoplasma procyoni TaxID=568784 RepID=UPI00197BF4C6|nr:uracil-DNA glycosylase [Mycoplasma procyoni]MBN3534365.1 uracil-DNA glycosylase [Mycoplasma procyoni]
MITKQTMQDFLEQEYAKKYFIDLLAQINQIRLKHTVFPLQKDLLRVFEVTNFDDLKVVVIGQDPYHQPNQADGLAFSSQDTKLPKSLFNIYKEIKKDYSDFSKKDADLSNWAKQGVLLLNRVMSVSESQPGSHYKLGWEVFTKAVLDFIVQNQNNTIFLLLGAKAQEIEKEIDLSNQIIIKLSHPSPLSYRRSFENSRVFKKINEILEQNNREIIDWNK